MVQAIEEKATDADQEETLKMEKILSARENRRKNVDELIVESCQRLLFNGYDFKVWSRTDRPKPFAYENETMVPHPWSHTAMDQVRFSQLETIETVEFLVKGLRCDNATMNDLFDYCQDRALIFGM